MNVSTILEDKTAIGVNVPEILMVTAGGEMVLKQGEYKILFTSKQLKALKIIIALEE